MQNNDALSSDAIVGIVVGKSFNIHLAINVKEFS